MRPQQLIQATSELPAEQEPVRPVSTSSYREAHQQLCRMFAATRTLVALSGESKCGTSYLVDHFLAGVRNNATVVRINAAQGDESALMNAVIRGIGFDPTNLDLADLENVFSLFLSHQNKHRTRTILCLEGIQDCGLWLVNFVHRISEKEGSDNHGLMLLLAGQSAVDDTLLESMLDAITSSPEQIIHVANFTLAETREYLRWRIESSGTAKIVDVFEFDAVTLVHELTGGDADAVSALGFKCLQIASKANSVPVTVGLVNEAWEVFDTPPESLPDVEAIEPIVEDQVLPRGGRLVVRLGEHNVKEYSLQRSHVLIGRGKLCDVRIASPSVSRHHALVISTPDGPMLVDLESTNGTIVDGRQIKEHPLQSSGVITLGDCKVDFIADDDHDCCVLDVHGASRSKPFDAEFETRKLEAWTQDDSDNDAESLEGFAIKGNINNKGDKIYHVPGSPKYSATKIDESKGERWFHSEDDAIAAGWRAPRIG